MTSKYKILENIVSHSWGNLSKKLGMHCYGTVIFPNPERLHCIITLLGSKHSPEYDFSNHVDRITYDDDEVLLQTEIQLTENGPQTQVLEEKKFAKMMKVTHEYNKTIPYYLGAMYEFPPEKIMVYQTTTKTISQLSEFKKKLGTHVPHWRPSLNHIYAQSSESWYDEVFEKLGDKYVIKPMRSRGVIDFNIHTLGGKKTSHSQHQEIHLSIVERTPQKSYASKKRGDKYVKLPLAKIKFHYDPIHNNWNSEFINQSSAKDTMPILRFYDVVLDDMRQDAFHIQKI